MCLIGRLPRSPSINSARDKQQERAASHTMGLLTPACPLHYAWEIHVPIVSLWQAEWSNVRWLLPVSLSFFLMLPWTAERVDLYSKGGIEFLQHGRERCTLRGALVGRPDPLPQAAWRAWNPRFSCYPSIDFICLRLHLSLPSPLSTGFVEVQMAKVAHMSSSGTLHLPSTVQQTILSVPPWTRRGPGWECWDTFPDTGGRGGGRGGGGEWLIV